ncbi:hypothetical protein [Rufibacter psychrotolerans]|uniref:hypothetical protein n=1 Tax=Rufibacter psychrotolerans TaxID=2812556 RepID=UPI0019683709|nr:hypothetical protein [Rufibacter sp. SYSU D00308]
MRTILGVLMIMMIPFAGVAQTTFALANQPTPKPSVHLALPAPGQEKDPSVYRKRGDTFLLLGIGLNIVSAGSYLMAPAFFKKPHDPTTEYMYFREVAKNDPVVLARLQQEYDQKMGVYRQEVNDRNRKIRNTRYAFAAAFTLGVTLDLAAVLNFKKARQAAASL